MISPIPTPTPDLSWLAHYIPTRTPEAATMAVTLTSADSSGAGLIIVGIAIILLIIGLWWNDSHRCQKS